MKMSRDEDFASQRVHFTRYELLKILGWPENGQNYRRIDEGLNRIIGTHLVWDNAFWDKRELSWVDRKFSIIDDVHLYDREKWDRARQKQGEGRPQSWFKWSDVMFESFQAGYIKSVDLDVLWNIDESVGKRLYRWLDKHFNNPKRKMPIEIPIAKLATQKLGFQAAPASHLQRMLAPAIAELEAMSYIAPELMRFKGSGKNTIVRFYPSGRRRGAQSPSRPKAEPPSQELEPLAQTLISLRMNPKTAAKWAREEPAESAFQIEHLDQLLKSGWKPRNGAGAWLNAAIPGKFKPSPGLKSEQRQEKTRAAQHRDQNAKRQQERERQAVQTKTEQQRKGRVASYLSTLTAGARQSLEEASVQNATESFRWRLEELTRDGDSQIVLFYREKLLCDYVEQLLDRER